MCHLSAPSLYASFTTLYQVLVVVGTWLLYSSVLGHTSSGQTCVHAAGLGRRGVGSRISQEEKLNDALFCVEMIAALYSYNEVGDRGAEYLAPALARLSSLETLFLRK